MVGRRRGLRVRDKNADERDAATARVTPEMGGCDRASEVHVREIRMRRSVERFAENMDSRRPSNGLEGSEAWQRITRPFSLHPHNIHPSSPRPGFS